MSQGDHHHFLWLRPEAQIEVLTPISPHIELGTLDITMELSTQVNSETRNIMPDKSLLGKSTLVIISVMLEVRDVKVFSKIL